MRVGTGSHLGGVIICLIPLIVKYPEMNPARHPLWWHFEFCLILPLIGCLSHCQWSRMLILLCSLIKGRRVSALQLLRDSRVLLVRWHPLASGLQSLPRVLSSV
jgi:hypothetical protein